MTLWKREIARLPKCREHTRSLWFIFPTTLNTTQNIIAQISFTKDYARRVNILAGLTKTRKWFKAPLITFPLAVFLKILRRLIATSDLGLLYRNRTMPAHFFEQWIKDKIFISHCYVEIIM